jgi:hypothetical protein
VIPAVIPPPQLTYLKVGQELPIDEARIGPPEGYLFKVRDGVVDENSVEKYQETLERTSPSTAIIASQEDRGSGGGGGQIIVTPPEPPKPPKPPVNPPEKPIDDVTKPPSTSGGSGGGGSGGSSGSTSPI